MTRLERAEAEVEAARLDRDEAIVQMLDHGVSLGRVATQLGLSRALVQQTASRVARARARQWPEHELHGSGDGERHGPARHLPLPAVAQP